MNRAAWLQDRRMTILIVLIYLVLPDRADDP
jgi:hypothetical protein